MYEFPIFIIISVTLECGMGILFGVGVGYDPILVYIASITLNFLSVLAVVALIDRLFRWKKGLGDWIKKRLGRGQKLIDKYGGLRHYNGCFHPLSNTTSRYWQTVIHETFKTPPFITWSNYLGSNSLSGYCLGSIQILA